MPADLPVAAPDPAETIRRVTEPAAQEYGWAWIDQPWQDYMDDVAGDKRAADFIRECDPKSVLALLAERQQDKERIEAQRLGLEAAERALGDAEKIILGSGARAWVGTLTLRGVRILLREGRWPDSQECAAALAVEEDAE